MPKTENQQAGKKASKPVSDEIKADEKPTIKSPSLFLYETIKGLNNYSPLTRESIICALQGYFVTAYVNEHKRSFGVYS